ncbi:hypothetical protein Leryth_001385 [Lithospermum erythrorhizon]|nr:hypothetical protein Leryth_001385 [Lithospermum erythrorhizon]
MTNTILVLITCILSVSSPSLSYHNQDISLSTSRTLEKEPKAHEIHCSRERSRLAWRAINQYVMPFVERERYELPIQCRLHPVNNIFRDHEAHKILVDLNEWRCGYCKKAFRGERFLDQHFDNRHYNLLNISHGKCMAELCGALHCDLVMETKPPKTKCNPAAVSRNRHMCEEIADSCFPLNQGRSATRLHDLFLLQFCDAHACSGEVVGFFYTCRRIQIYSTWQLQYLHCC